MSLINPKEYQIINLETWVKSEEYAYFSKLDNPCHSLVTELNCTKCYLEAKKSDKSFFAQYLHKSLKAANECEEFKLRIHNSTVLKMDKIHAAPTILRPNKSYGFAYVEYENTVEKFNENINAAKERVFNRKGLCIDETVDKLNVIHYSTIPWIHFTGMTFADNIKHQRGIPKITFGKIRPEKDNFFLPFGINVHHGLVDGVALGNYLTKFQELLNE